MLRKNTERKRLTYTLRQPRKELQRLVTREIMLKLCLSNGSANSIPQLPEDFNHWVKRIFEIDGVDFARMTVTELINFIILTIHERNLTR